MARREEKKAEWRYREGAGKEYLYISDKSSDRRLGVLFSSARGYVPDQ